MPDGLQCADKNVLMECLKICALNCSWSVQCKVTNTVEPNHISKPVETLLNVYSGHYCYSSEQNCTLNEQLINMSIDINIDTETWNALTRLPKPPVH